MLPHEQTRSELYARYIMAEADALVKKAANFGLVVTIAQQPLLPLAMGNHESVASVRPLRELSA